MPGQRSHDRESLAFRNGNFTWKAKLPGVLLDQPPKASLMLNTSYNGTVGKGKTYHLNSQGCLSVTLH